VDFTFRISVTTQTIKKVKATFPMNCHQKRILNVDILKATKNKKRIFFKKNREISAQKLKRATKITT